MQRKKKINWILTIVLVLGTATVFFASLHGSNHRI